MCKFFGALRSKTHIHRKRAHRLQILACTKKRHDPQTGFPTGHLRPSVPRLPHTFSTTESDCVHQLDKCPVRGLPTPPRRDKRVGLKAKEYSWLSTHRQKSEI